MPGDHTDNASTAQKQTSANVPDLYVAVGASAGGLEAIEAFFSGMVSDSGLAFIVIQHLSPDYKSLMKEILSKKTRMHVHRVQDGMVVLPNNIYLIPPKKNLTIFHGRLFLSEQEHTKGIINLPIDIFLRSLAEDQLDLKTNSPGTQGEKGTGLGLILCLEMIHRHQGEIWARSTSGKGTTFFFTLPDHEP